MTPKEKAKELVEKFYMLGMTWEMAKQCALIAGGEILKACDAVYDSGMVHFKETGDGQFWQQVKTEIKNL